MKIAIVGWGVEGKSAYKYFGPEHTYLIANEVPADDFPPESDTLKVKFPPGGKLEGMTSTAKDLSYLDGIEACDKIIFTISSAKNLENKFGKDNVAFWQRAGTIQDIFFETSASKNIIGVTGTKGKGTTSTLIAKMLEASGKQVHLGGNIGLGVLDFVRDVRDGDWIVMELSSFQLYRLSKSPHIAVCLMIAPEHLDWHGNFEDYLQAKSNIFKYQTEGDFAVYFAQNEFAAKIANYSKAKKIPFFEKPGALVREDGMIVVGESEIELLHKSEVRLLGEHNLQNVCAAITTFWQVEQNVEAIKSVAASFSGLEHRIEFVREVGGVSYYNDSFATTPETAIACIRSFPGSPKVLILGGSSKGSALNDLIEEVVNSDVRQVIAIGDTSLDIAKMLRDKGFDKLTTGLSDMSEIVAAAHEKAEAGDVVLLSTGHASFGLFKDYKDRGNQFKSVVNNL